MTDKFLLWIVPIGIFIVLTEIFYFFFVKKNSREDVREQWIEYKIQAFTLSVTLLMTGAILYQIHILIMQLIEKWDWKGIWSWIFSQSQNVGIAIVILASAFGYFAINYRLAMWMKRGKRGKPRRKT